MCVYIYMYIYVQRSNNNPSTATALSHCLLPSDTKISDVDVGIVMVRIN